MPEIVPYTQQNDSTYPLFVDDVVENSTPLTDYPKVSTDLNNGHYLDQELNVNAIDDNTIEDKSTRVNNTYEDDIMNARPKVNGSKFSCYGRQFGQYADVDKDCRVFHLCYPFINDESEGFVYQRITFLCQNQTVFDQNKLICVDNSTVDYPCHESPLHYQESNKNYVSRILSYLNSININRSTQTTTPRPSALWSYLFNN